MATQKQRRKRAKEKRHTYDLVEIDAEGNETVLTASAVKSESASKGSAGKTEPQKSGGAKRGRGVAQPPSWRRVAKRGALFAPIFLATVLLLSGGRLTFAGAVIQTIFLLAVFVPFSYAMDHFVWRSHQKRLAKSGGR